ncbi:MAG: sulfotransferase [Actinomycetota bacterium]
MTRARLERMWVGLANSHSMRRLRRSAPLQRLASLSAARDLDMRRRRLVARREGRRHPDRFDHLEALCLFVGHTKSGGTLLGAMIDAHPQAVVADEVDVLRHLEAGLSRREILDLLVRNARREALKGRVTARRLGGYSLAVPSQWQGSYREIQVVGESRAGPTTRRLGSGPGGLEALRELAAPARLRLVHVVRNPLDPIAAMVRRGGRTVESATADYAAQAERLETVRSRLEPDELITVRYEELVGDPRLHLSRVLGHLGLEAREDHLGACATLVDARRSREREWIQWSPAQIEGVAKVAEGHGFLAPYRSHVGSGEGPGGC